MDFAELVNDLLRREGLTPYALAKRLNGQISQRSVYDFLSGKAVRSKTLAAILEACEITLEVRVGTITLDHYRMQIKNNWPLRLPGLKLKWLKHEHEHSECDNPSSD